MCNGFINFFISPPILNVASPFCLAHIALQNFKFQSHNVLFSTFLIIDINIYFSLDFMSIFIFIWLHIIGVCMYNSSCG